MTETQPPADSTRAILHGLGIQQRERERALGDLARLRKEASAEITRLIAFLDASDPYVMTELEEQQDEEPSPGWLSDKRSSPFGDDLELDDSDDEVAGDGEAGGSLKCRSRRKGRNGPIAHMIKVTESHGIRPYKWVHPER
ncbi:hypothetical protein IVB41_32265 [Bradyrhizobium sp. 44]|uniref:hypothetical protein n=1 Tax=unclassified Bradyrhizobium TaxID=2631580 RepID=UPI001FFB83F1|nr:MULTISPECIES: hypothetical protein [unclassified Bradyrhizobium]MCK1288585.1 hypothetical protein [Bradyrhizobium sp. 44]UPJ43958.1 hypothetical protein IVB40_07780 [Bradyrhizobium sp. 40]